MSEDIRICPLCHTRVWPMPDGTCPSCKETPDSWGSIESNREFPSVASGPKDEITPTGQLASKEAVGPATEEDDITRIPKVDRSNAKVEVAANGKFVKVLLPWLSFHGLYRGEGKIEVSDQGVAFLGRHVYSLAARWAFGVGLAIAILVLTLGTFAPGILLLYPIVEYVWLKEENILVPFEDITAYSVKAKRKLVGIEFQGYPWCSPAVMKSEEWDKLVAALDRHLPADKKHVA